VTQLYEAAVQKTTTAAAGAIVSLLAGASSRPDIREIGIFMSSAPTTGPTIGIGRPANAGTASTNTLGQATDINDPASTCNLSSAYSAAPTAPAVFMRRITLPNTIGAGVIWTFDRQDLNIAPSGAFIIWQTSALAVTYDVYVKWEE
jgi:hypothetical protein